MLLHAMRAGVQFSVIVADAGPKFEGRECMRRLLAAGLRCTYVGLHALTYRDPRGLERAPRACAQARAPSHVRMACAWHVLVHTGT